IVRALVHAQARSLGLDIDYESIDVHLSGVTLGKATIKLDGVPGLRARADAIDLDLGAWSLSRVEARPLVVVIAGGITERLAAIRAWSAAHPAIYRVPNVSHQVRIDWSERANQPPWLVITGGTLAAGDKGGKLDALGTSVFGVPLGAVSSTWPEDVA